MTRNQAIEIARLRALNTREGHGYLPVTEADAQTWMPHEWVIDAILWATMQCDLAAQQAPGFTEMVPLEVYESAVRGRQEMRDALREEREKTKNLTRALGEAVNGPTFMGEPVIAQQAAQPVAQEPRVCWLVEEFSDTGNSTGRYMQDQIGLTITTDAQQARRFLGSRVATFRATDMREKWGTAWRPVSHVFRAAQPQQDNFKDNK